MGTEVIPQETLDRLHTALNPSEGAKPETNENPATETSAETEAPATEGDADTTSTAFRDDKGRFKKKEMSAAERGLLAATKAERDKRKALERELAEIKEQLSKQSKTSNADKPSRRKDLLEKAPEETREFWESTADPLIEEMIEERIQRRLEELSPDIQEIRSIREARQREQVFMEDLQEFVEDQALEGYDIDPKALVETLTRFEQEYDISLGSNNRKKFENAMGLMENQSPAVVEKTTAKPDKSEEKARAGGVVPQTTPGQAPPDRAALGKSVRELAGKGDLRSISEIIGQRVPKHPLLRK